MTIPAPAAPFRVPLGPGPGAPAGGAAPGRPAVSSGGSLGKILSTPKGQLGAAAVAVAGYALYRRSKNASATDAATAAANTSTTAGSPQGTADTSLTDLYGMLEPLVEQLSGYNDAGTLASIQSELGTALGNTSGSTSTSTGSTSGSSTTIPPANASGVPSGWITEIHAVGAPGKGVNILDYIKSLRPGITAQQATAAEYATIINPANKALGLGKSPIIPGGDRVTFVLPGKPTPQVVTSTSINPVT